MEYGSSYVRDLHASAKALRATQIVLIPLLCGNCRRRESHEIQGQDRELILRWVAVRVDVVLYLPSVEDVFALIKSVPLSAMEIRTLPGTPGGP